MMCNIARAYPPERQESFCVFSRVRPDMLFGESDSIEIFAFGRLKPLRVTWRLCRNRVETPFRSGEGEIGIDQGVRLVVPADGLVPGFYDLHFTIHATGTVAEEGLATFGYRVADMPLPQTLPGDFDTFWAAGLDKLDRVAPRAATTPVREMTDAEISAYNVESASMPEALDPEGHTAGRIRVFKLRFDSAGRTGPRRFTGWLAVPAVEGPFPGLLVLPGAGNAPLPIPAEHARHGYAALMLQIHGMDVEGDAYRAPGTYLKGPSGPAPEENYYHEVILACVQAARCLAARKDVKPGALGVAGGSQGGFLALATAALCPEVAAAASSICFHADWPFRERVAELNRLKSDGTDTDFAAVPPDDERGRLLAYYDAMNFAARVSVPTLMSVCLSDHASPATTVWSAYRHLPAQQKRLCVSPGTSHDFMVAFERAGWRWMEQHLAL